MNKIINFFHNDRLADIVLIIVYLFVIFSCIGSAFYVIYEMLNLYPKILNRAKDTNLGLLLQSFKDNGLFCLLLSLVITYLFSVFWVVVTFVYNLNENKNYIQITLLCILGVYLITFIFLFLLASTTPSNSTIVFSTLSTIGASISFCYTVFINNRGNL
ncbi:hypothetical protein K2V58_00260 [Staphylococcus arlettae]|uniref:hypothetical protein n=1 Tax=Staphylococcus arlettae TaxID=29378 RepID=UPI001E56A66C|nr:hypothetical protein [Staphylococcus arlettae]MCD8832739.1 hypothetical protein [Staphylococcus arlettae]